MGATPQCDPRLVSAARRDTRSVGDQRRDDRRHGDGAVLRRDSGAGPAASPAVPAVPRADGAAGLRQPPVPAAPARSGVRAAGLSGGSGDRRAGATNLPALSRGRASRCMIQRATRRLREGRAAEAESVMRAWIELYPQDTRALHLLATAKLRQDRVEAAHASAARL